jgi:hypothetical protein
MWWNQNRGINQVSGMPGVVGPIRSSLPKERHLGLVISLVASVILVVGLGAFGFWAYSQMKDYKNNSDQKSAQAVAQAMADQATTLETQFTEQEKSPLKSYISPAAYGSVTIVYPKTWSAYVNEQTSGSNVVDGYFYQNYLPSVGSSETTNYNLRVQIVGGSYQTAVDQYQAQIKQGKVTAAPYTPNVVGASTGVRLTGQLTATKKGAMIIVPLRDKVLKIWTETEAGIADLDNYVIANLTFSP